MSEYESFAQIPEQESPQERRDEDPLLPEEIPSGWKVVRIGDIKDHKVDRIDPSEMASEAYVSLKHLDKGENRIKRHGKAEEVNSAKYSFTQGDILFGKLRPIFNKVVLADIDGICSTDINVIQPIEGINRDYLTYTLSRGEFIRYADKTATGTRMPRADWDELNDVLVAVPSTDEQVLIANHLASLDDRIERANEVMDHCAEFTKELFAKEFESSLGEEGPTISDLTERQNESVVPDENPDTEYDLYDFSSFDEKKQPVKEYGDEISSRKYSLNPDSVLLSKLNPRIPRVWYVSEPGENAICSTEFVVLKPDKKAVQDFLYALFRTETFQGYLESHITGTSGSHQRVKISDIMSFRIGEVPMERIKWFSKMSRPAHQRWETEGGLKQTLKELRDTLLPKLLSGEIRLPT